MNLIAKKSSFAALLGAAVLSLSASASAVTLNIAVTEDTALGISDSSFFTSSNYGGGPTLFVAPFLATGSLMRFDTASLGLLSGATINSVTLNLTVAVNGTSAFNANDIARLRIAQLTAANSGWVEGTAITAGTAGSNELAATNDWLVKTVGGDPGEGTPWAAGGDFATGTGPIAGNIVSSEQISDLGGESGMVFNVNQTYQFAISNGTVSGWVDNPTLATAGLFLYIPTSTAFISRWNFGFHSSEATTLEYRPYIVVDYTPVPEPSIVGALVGGFALLGLRRRGRKAGQAV